jgi:hypothetical protein
MDNKQRRARGKLNTYWLSGVRVCRAKGLDSLDVVTHCVVRVDFEIQKFWFSRIIAGSFGCSSGAAVSNVDCCSRTTTG